MPAHTTDHELLAAWYRQYGPMVLRRCRKLLGEEEQALDACHTVFTRVLGMKNLHGILEPARYFFRSATRICIDCIRSRKRRCHEGEDLLASIACTERSEERTIAGFILDRFFSRQRALSREIAVMVMVDGMDYRETAQALGISVSTVKNRLKEIAAKARQFQLEGGR